MNKYVSITGVWEDNHEQYGKSLSFRMSQEVKDKMMAVPVGTFVKLYPSKFKDEKPNAPAWNMTYKGESENPF